MFRGLVIAVFLALTLSFSAVAPVLGADPSPAVTPGASDVIIDPLDPRAGEGANRIGAPLLAIVFVLGVGTLTILATYAYIRASRRA